jgi:hypothetical protein
MRLTKKQRAALELVAQGRCAEGVNQHTLNSLHRHRLIRRAGDGWKLGIMGEMILAGWTLNGLARLERWNDRPTSESE